MSKNIIDKIWDAHIVKSENGYPDIFAIDLQLVHEVTSPQGFNELRRRDIKIFNRQKMIATVDHNIPTDMDRLNIRDEASRKQVEALRTNCKEFDVKLLDMGSGKQGIVHVIGPELGLTQPGMTVVCGDSHTSTHGAFGAIAFGIGSTEVGHVMASGCLLQARPKTMKVEFSGKLGKGVTAKDLILKLIQKIGIGGGTGYIIEYTGDAIRQLTMEQRMTVCNMSIECGARAGLIAPDETTFEYINGREAVVSEKWDEAIEYWKSLLSEDDAKYDKVVAISLDGMAPMVTWGTNPSQSVQIDETVPSPADMDAVFAGAAERALEYVQLNADDAIEGTPIDYVFIGSCTNGRLSDLREAAGIFKDRKVAEGVKVYVVPGSEQVAKMAIEEGLDKIFTDAGADFRQPGCSMCLAMNDDKVPEGKRCASTSNRNFMGRQGKGSITHLMSPIMAAAAAIEGKITDVRKLI